ncbi:hypothetical protein [Vibrio vulnificus YJ016]|uniref:Uncharacterized protein n=1 Tax=Vibrio vulnificus (strain YJ016) TaxID=196600 RepID=Q7MHG7_VIBVY|nr:hypothetical protein [Vibrio vulnificus YJ016]
MMGLTRERKKWKAICLPFFMVSLTRAPRLFSLGLSDFRQQNDFCFGPNVVKAPFLRIDWHSEICQTKRRSGNAY